MSDLRSYVFSWFDARSMPEGQCKRKLIVRAVDARDAITLFEKNASPLELVAWTSTTTTKVRALGANECETCCGEGQGPSAELAPRQRCRRCNGTGKKEPTPEKGTTDG